ncbi:hypothetical protein [Sphingomonas sp.]|uniref:luciferase domain-containing protein n=1 Tax=Sphingomonas sp. TaxID=28214 RepID=UPI0025F6BC99|nr:hypothetical protein [Sphingomonas sp.]
MRIRPSTLAVLGAVAAPAAGALAWAISDYRAWRALGPGGLPSTFGGWLTTTRLRLQKRDPLALDALLLARGETGDVATLAALPLRLGARPRVSPHPVPQRQLSDLAPPALRVSLADAFAARAASDGERLDMISSHFEKHNVAVTARVGLRRHPVACAACGEAGHVHPSDGSMHMILSPSDACAVIAGGWGELHGLAGHAFDLPPTYILIYAPRDADEVAVVMQILDAAIAYITCDPALPAVA